MRLQDKAALITGAASSISKAIATRFGREGARVCIADRGIENTQRVVDEIKAFGGVAMAVTMDVTDERQVNAGVNQTVERYGSIDVLVSNAGIQHTDPIDELSYDDWRKVVAIHLDGAFLTTTACLPHMYKAGRGSVIYMGSVHSKEGSPLQAPYVTAKHGLLGLCRVVAMEGAEYNVRANVICPGLVRTPPLEKQIPEQAEDLGISEEEVIKHVVLKDTVDTEFTAPSDVAELAVFLASFPSKALTGQSLVVSHGWHME